MQRIAAIALALMSLTGPTRGEELAVPMTFSLDAVSYFESPDSHRIRTDASGTTHVTIRFQGRKFVISYRKSDLTAESFVASMWFQVRSFEVVSGRTIHVSAVLHGGSQPDPMELEILVTYNIDDYPEGSRIDNILIDYLWGVLICQESGEKRICLPFHVLGYE